MWNRRGLLAAIAAVLVGMPALEGSAAAATAGGGQETILLADDFDDPAQGKLSSFDTPRFYDSGEYVMMKIGPYTSTSPVNRLRGTYGDASIAVDVRLVGETAGRSVAVGCRQRPLARAEGYRLVLEPTAARFALMRLDDGRPVPLVDWQSSSAIRTGLESNRLELTCSGSRVKATINGIELAVAEDHTYATGEMEVGPSPFFLGGGRLSVEARLDNLVVTEAPAGDIPGRVLLAENFDDAGRGEFFTLDALRVYDSGEYLISKLSEHSSVAPIVRLPGNFADASLAVDARLVGQTASRNLTVGCRDTTGAGTLGGYRLVVDPNAGTAVLLRMGGPGVSQVLARADGSAVIRTGNASIRLELRCAGNTITASANNVELASIQDDSYRDGEMIIGANAAALFASLTVEARFDNLVVTASEPRGVPVPAPVQVPSP